MRYLCKALLKTSKKWIEGYYVRQEQTTYCFKDDADKDPDNVKHYIVFDRSIDWGLPNKHIKAEVDGDTVCEAVDGLKTTDGRQLFEHDIVNIKTTSYSFEKYEIIWNDKELCFCGRKETKPSETDKLCTGFDFIRLSADWRYEYCYNTCERSGTNE